MKSNTNETTTTVTPQHQRLTLTEYRKLYGSDLKGRIVEYVEPLDVAIYPDKGPNKLSMMPTATAGGFGRYQRVEGGFGSNLNGHGRTVMGPFFKDLKDAIADDRLEFSSEQLELLKSMVPPIEYEDLKGFQLSESTKEQPDFVIIIEGGEQ